MSHELKEGVKLNRISFDLQLYEEVGRYDVVDITVREQVGQMSMVPWIEVTRCDPGTRDTTRTLYNPDHLLSIELAALQNSGVRNEG